MKINCFSSVFVAGLRRNARCDLPNFEMTALGFTVQLAVLCSPVKRVAGPGMLLNAFKDSCQKYKIKCAVLEPYQTLWRFTAMSLFKGNQIRLCQIGRCFQVLPHDPVVGQSDCRLEVLFP